MRMKHTLTALMTLILCCTSVWQELMAQPNLGGEIRWECTSQGHYRFLVVRYRDCQAVSYPSTINMISNVPGFSSITLNRVEIKELSPVCGCPNGGSISCSTPTIPPGLNGSTEAHIYTSDVSYPNGVTLTGVPPASGWYFAYNDCCRGYADNLSWGQSNYAFVSRMYPYNGLPVNNCYDNAPAFHELPSPAFCTGHPAVLNHHAKDSDGDSLVYEITPLMANYQTVLQGYASGYSTTSPLPGTIHNPLNVPAALIPGTGMISLTSHTSGRFAYAVKISSYRNGLKIAEVMREFFVLFTPCDTINTPPGIAVPLSALPGQSFVWVDTVTVGELVTFSPTFYDFNHCAGTGNMVPQSISVQAYGEMFAAPMNPEGCLTPPCATLIPVTNNDTPLTIILGITPLFAWQTGCNHLTPVSGQLNTSREYDFIFKVTDNHCPIPGVTYGLVRIVVLPYPRIASPQVKCISVLPNGDVFLTWEPSTDTLNSFNSYHILHSVNQAGPYTVVDSIFNIQAGQWLHAGAGADTQTGYYLITTRSGCDGQEMMPPTDTLQSILLQAVFPGAAGASFTLQWNNPLHPLNSSGSQVYEVWRKLGTGSWTVVGHTTNTFWHDMDKICNDSVEYRIELADTVNTSACRSVSNRVSGFFANVVPPTTPTVQMVTVDQITEKGQLIWSSITDQDFECYIVTTILSSSAILTDTLWSRNDTSWTDMVNDPCAGTITYRVSAMDICSNVSGYSEPHNTMNLAVQILPGNTSALLTWTPYLTLVYGSGGGYSIWFSVNGNVPFHLLSKPPSSSTHIHSNLTPGDTLCYILYAFDPTQKLWSNSCEVCAAVPTGLSEAYPLAFFVGQNIPNPVTGQTHIPFVVPESGTAQLVIRHLTGQVVWQKEMQVTPGKQHFVIGDGSLMPGVYLYAVNFRGSVQIRKMTVQ